MKSTKKARTLTVSKAKVKKTSTKTVKTSAPKKKADVKVSVSKAQCVRTRPKDSPKPGKSRVNHAKDSGKTRESITKKHKDRRHHHELSSGEYDAFVIQTAAIDKVPPKELVTVDRRKAKSSMPEQSASKQKQDRRKKIKRRRQIDPTTCERDYSQEEIEFMNALDEYKRNSGRMFPTCSEILEVFRNLGYARLLHEESVEIIANTESGDTSIAATETGTTHQADESYKEPSCLSLSDF